MPKLSSYRNQSIDLQSKWVAESVNTLTPGAHWQASLQMKAASLFKYVCPISKQHALKNCTSTIRNNCFQKSPSLHIAFWKSIQILFLGKTDINAVKSLFRNKYRCCSFPSTVTVTINKQSYFSYFLKLLSPASFIL